MPTKPLSKKDIKFLQLFSTSCRHSILSMVTNAQSGHPGGSLSCIDYLSLLYTKIIAQTGETVVVSNGHISPAVYAVLAELGYISKKNVLTEFRALGSIYEGHVARTVRGVMYSTGPLGAGVSAASGFALSEKLKRTNKRVFALIGDGESQEGQVYEMMHVAAKYKLDNFVVFMDYNQVQLSDSLKNIMPLQPKKLFQAAGWEVVEVDGHDFSALWLALNQTKKHIGKPLLILGKTIMGKGVDFMEKVGKQHKADWHGKAPTPDQIVSALSQLTLTTDEQQEISAFKKTIHWKPKQPTFSTPLSPMPQIKPGKPITYPVTEQTDCRTAYGKALLDLAKHNKSIVALTADLSESVRTSYLKEVYPDRHIECGIAEQQMVSCAGGLSLAGFIPFCSTFGAFMTSRAKDQARVNDINQTNVKMVATHCGLSVGEDGPTHQAIDDMGSMLGLFNTMIIEPADPNQTDRIIRYIASHYGNFYVRMGRHKIPTLTKEDGSLLFSEQYEYRYGRCDLVRSGTDITLVASGSMVSQALQAVVALKKEKGMPSVELICVSSPKQFDETLFDSIEKTKRVLVVEDHNTRSGIGSQIATTLLENHVHTKAFHLLGVSAYQPSGDAIGLYHLAGIGAEQIKAACVKLVARSS